MNGVENGFILPYKKMEIHSLAATVDSVFEDESHRLII
jgi:hypothetical protein